MVVLRPTLPRPMAALLEHGDIGDAVVAGQVVGGGEPMPAAADDDHVVAGFGLRIAPGALPALMAAQGFAKDAQA